MPHFFFASSTRAAFATSFFEVGFPIGVLGQGCDQTATAAVAPMTSTADDAELMEAVGRGDPAAYRELVQRHLRGIHAFAYRMLGNRAEAEEVCQDSFLRLWTSGKSYRARAKPSTWLYRIAHNLAVDRLRRRRESTDMAAIEAAVDSGRGSQELHDRQIALAVERALSELPERQRAAISLIHYQGMSSAEAADVMGVKLRALESLLARGRRQLRERLRTLREEGSEA